MFDKFRFRAKANFIMLKEFNYDTAKLLPALRANWYELECNCYAAGGQPADAAVLFMLAQINILSGEARNGAFAQNVLRMIDRVQWQMSAEARAELPGWLNEFHAETERLENDPAAFFRDVLPASNG